MSTKRIIYIAAVALVLRPYVYDYLVCGTYKFYRQIPVVIKAHDAPMQEVEKAIDTPAQAEPETSNEAEQP